jgi:hypothetical protein
MAAKGTVTSPPGNARIQRYAKGSPKSANNKKG